MLRPTGLTVCGFYRVLPQVLFCAYLDGNFVRWKDDIHHGSHFQPNRLIAFPLFNLLSSQALNHLYNLFPFALLI